MNGPFQDEVLDFGAQLQCDETGGDPENPIPLNSGICLRKASMI